MTIEAIVEDGHPTIATAPLEPLAQVSLNGGAARLKTAKRAQLMYC